MSDKSKDLSTIMEAVNTILSAPEVKHSPWPNQSSAEFRQKIEAKTDACAAFMLKKMIDCIWLYKRKNPDYGDAFAKTYAQFGPISALIRISDKINRITSLMEQGGIEPKVLDESVTDTLIDLVNYSLMTMYEMEQSSK